MAGITVSHLSFTYPQETVPALRDVSFSVEEGEFLTVIGPSGGGKSTLLRALKPALTPHGSFTGDISFFGEPLSALDARRQAAEIGFVLQKPDEQIVTDRVWHELAFGMESLGFATPVIRRRVAEMASFFGIEEWFSRPVEALSGGQKQLLNLASVMALQPRVLLLDEPTSQLDPIAAADFLNAVARIRRELGTTVILSEHRLEEALPLCDRVLALEQTVLAHGTPQEVSRTLRAAKSPVYFSMPTPVRVSGSVGADKCPVTVTEGRQWLAGYAAAHPLADVPPRRLRPAGEELLGLKDVWFRYEKDGEDVLQDLSCSFARGQLTALLGGNGSGKTTLITRLIPELTGRGYKVAVIKHDGHDFKSDVPGTDSYRHQKAGAYGTAVFSKNRFLITKECHGITERDLFSAFPEADIILIEGLKNSSYPKYFCAYPEKPLPDAAGLADEMEKIMQQTVPV